MKCLFCKRSVSKKNLSYHMVNYHTNTAIERLVNLHLDMRSVETQTDLSDVEDAIECENATELAKPECDLQQTKDVPENQPISGETEFNIEPQPESTESINCKSESSRSPSEASACIPRITVDSARIVRYRCLLCDTYDERREVISEHLSNEHSVGLDEDKVVVDTWQSIEPIMQCLCIWLPKLQLTKEQKSLLKAYKKRRKKRKKESLVVRWIQELEQMEDLSVIQSNGTEKPIEYDSNFKQEMSQIQDDHSDLLETTDQSDPTQQNSTNLCPDEREEKDNRPRNVSGEKNCGSQSVAEVSNLHDTENTLNNLSEPSQIHMPGQDVVTQNIHADLNPVDQLSSKPADRNAMPNANIDLDNIMASSLPNKELESRRENSQSKTAQKNKHTRKAKPSSKADNQISSGNAKEICDEKTTDNKREDVHEHDNRGQNEMPLRYTTMESPARPMLSSASPCPSLCSQSMESDRILKSSEVEGDCPGTGGSETPRVRDSILVTNSIELVAIDNMDDFDEMESLQSSPDDGKCHLGTQMDSSTYIDDEVDVEVNAEMDSALEEANGDQATLDNHEGNPNRSDDTGQLLPKVVNVYSTTVNNRIDPDEDDVEVNNPSNQIMEHQPSEHVPSDAACGTPVNDANEQVSESQSATTSNEKESPPQGRQLLPLRPRPGPRSRTRPPDYESTSSESDDNAALAEFSTQEYRDYVFATNAAYSRQRRKCKLSGNSTTYSVRISDVLQDPMYEEYGTLAQIIMFEKWENLKKSTRKKRAKKLKSTDVSSRGSSEERGVTTEKTACPTKTSLQRHGSRDLNSSHSVLEADKATTLEVGTNLSRQRVRKSVDSLLFENNVPSVDSEGNQNKRGCVLKKKCNALNALLSELLAKFMEKDEEKFFLYPIDDKIAPGYSSKISKPMDFSTMENKIDQKCYSRLDQFKEDFFLVCKNCLKFNEPETVYHQAALRLRKYGNFIFSKDNLAKMISDVPMFSEITPLEMGWSADDLVAIVFEEEDPQMEDENPKNSTAPPPEVINRCRTSVSLDHEVPLDELVPDKNGKRKFDSIFQSSKGSIVLPIVKRQKTCERAGLDTDEQIKQKDMILSKGKLVRCGSCRKLCLTMEFSHYSEVPSDWLCHECKESAEKNSMEVFKEPESSSASIPNSDKPSEKYPRGTLVWAKYKKDPFWPGIIEKCPKTDKLTKTVDDKKQNTASSSFHVLFLEAGKSRMSWVEESFLTPVQPDSVDKPPDASPDKEDKLPASKRSRYKHALIMAKELIDLDPEARLAKIASGNIVPPPVKTTRMDEVLSKLSRYTDPQLPAECLFSVAYANLNPHGSKVANVAELLAFVRLLFPYFDLNEDAANELARREFGIKADEPNSFNKTVEVDPVMQALVLEKHKLDLIERGKKSADFFLLPEAWDTIVVNPYKRDFTSDASSSESVKNLVELLLLVLPVSPTAHQMLVFLSAVFPSTSESLKAIQQILKSSPNIKLIKAKGHNNRYELKTERREIVLNQFENSSLSNLSNDQLSSILLDKFKSPLNQANATSPTAPPLPLEMVIYYLFLVEELKSTDSQRSISLDYMTKQIVSHFPYFADRQVALSAMVQDAMSQTCLYSLSGGSVTVRSDFKTYGKVILMKNIMDNFERISASTTDQESLVRLFPLMPEGKDVVTKNFNKHCFGVNQTRLNTIWSIDLSEDILFALAIMNLTDAKSANIINFVHDNFPYYRLSRTTFGRKVQIRTFPAADPAAVFELTAAEEKFYKDKIFQFYSISQVDILRLPNPEIFNKALPSTSHCFRPQRTYCKPHLSHESLVGLGVLYVSDPNGWAEAADVINFIRSNFPYFGQNSDVFSNDFLEVGKYVTNILIGTTSSNVFNVRHKSEIQINRNRLLYLISSLHDSFDFSKRNESYNKSIMLSPALIKDIVSIMPPFWDDYYTHLVEEIPVDSDGVATEAQSHEANHVAENCPIEPNTSQCTPPPPPPQQPNYDSENYHEEPAEVPPHVDPSYFVNPVEREHYQNIDPQNINVGSLKRENIADEVAIENAGSFPMLSEAAEPSAGSSSMVMTSTPDEAILDRVYSKPVLDLHIKICVAHIISLHMDYQETNFVDDDEAPADDVAVSQFTLNRKYLLTDIISILGKVFPYYEDEAHVTEFLLKEFKQSKSLLEEYFHTLKNSENKLEYEFKISKCAEVYQEILCNPDLRDPEKIDAWFRSPVSVQNFITNRIALNDNTLATIAILTVGDKNDFFSASPISVLQCYIDRFKSTYIGMSGKPWPAHKLCADLLNVINMVVLYSDLPLWVSGDKFGLREDADVPKLLVTLKKNLKPAVKFLQNNSGLKKCVYDILNSNTQT